MGTIFSNLSPTTNQSENSLDSCKQPSDKDILEITPEMESEPPHPPHPCSPWMDPSKKDENDKWMGRYIIASQTNGKSTFLDNPCPLNIIDIDISHQQAEQKAERYSEQHESNNIFLFKVTNKEQNEIEDKSLLLERIWPYGKYRNGVFIIDKDIDINLRPIQYNDFLFNTAI